MNKFSFDKTFVSKEVVIITIICKYFLQQSWGLCVSIFQLFFESLKCCKNQSL